MRGSLTRGSSLCLQRALALQSTWRLAGSRAARLSVGGSLKVYDVAVAMAALEALLTLRIREDEKSYAIPCEATESRGKLCVQA